MQLINVKRCATPAKMRKPDGSLAHTALENAEVFASHFEGCTVYGRTPTFDASVLDSVPQLPVQHNLDGLPTDEEIHRALGTYQVERHSTWSLWLACARVGKKGSGATGLLPKLFTLLRQIMHCAHVLDTALTSS